MRLKNRQLAMTPVGVSSLLPERALLQRRLEQTAIDHFSRLGYQEVIPPMVEYFDVMAPVLGADLAERAYKFVDRSTGRVMVLRPDVTPQIARMVAQLLADHPNPLRFCYRATVFRHEEEHAGREREVMQIGAELIGPSDAAADAEMITLALSTLEQLGVTGYRAAIGHPGVFDGLLEEAGVRDPLAGELREALSRRDRAELRSLARAAALPSHVGQDIESLLDSIGQEEVLVDARRRFGRMPGGKAAAAVRRLSEIVERVKAAGYASALLVDLGEVRGFDYYTGMVFDLFAEGVGYEIGGGGRYDRLIGQFGADRPSTGFALYATPLVPLMAKRPSSAPPRPGDRSRLSVSKIIGSNDKKTRSRRGSRGRHGR